MEKLYILPRGTEPEGKTIASLIRSRDRKKDIKAYNLLEKYYNSGDVLLRRTPHKLYAITNYARYITKTNTGYFLGNPVSYSANDKVNLDSILQKYTAQTISTLDYELATDASIFGHAFEQVYVDEGREPKSTKIDPRNIILVHDDTVNHNKMFAVIYSGQRSSQEYDVTILDSGNITEGKLTGDVLAIDKQMPHIFGEVPIVEYINSSDRVGDYEPVLSLIDARNILQSDRVLDRERLVDAILAFYGTAFSEEQRKQLKNSRMLSNLPPDAKVEYIVKNINEADASVLLKAITDDIHMISMTPNMTDENFASNSSGVALSYKLIAFEQHIKDKERYFEKGLMDRLGLYYQFVNSTKDDAIAKDAVDIIFSRDLPKNDYETAQLINLLLDSGLVDRETLAGRLSFVKDPKEIVVQAQKEKEEDLKLGNYGTGEPDEADDPLDEE